MSELFVIKVGGSNFSISDEVLFDFNQLEKLKSLLLPLIEQGNRFILITGGGYIARKYESLLIQKNYPEYDVHYAGTAVCNLHAIMARAVFGDISEEKVVTFNDFENLNEIQFNKPVLFAGAAKPGPSSDWDAAVMADHFKAEVIISMKNINGVYSSDPKKDTNAKKIDKLDWNEYLNIIGNKERHIPGDNLPVDPIASRFSKEKFLSFYILDGNNLDSLANALNGQPFDGTIIS